jgi:hypothetical protein
MGSVMSPVQKAAKDRKRLREKRDRHARNAFLALIKLRTAIREFERKRSASIGLE